MIIHDQPVVVLRPDDQFAPPHQALFSLPLDRFFLKGDVCLI